MTMMEEENDRYNIEAKAKNDNCGRWGVTFLVVT